MSKNYSSVLDDRAAEFVEKERNRRGYLKSKAINVLINELIDSKPEYSRIDDFNGNLGKQEIEKKNVNEELKIDQIDVFNNISEPKEKSNFSVKPVITLLKKEEPKKPESDQSLINNSNLTISKKENTVIPVITTENKTKEVKNMADDDLGIENKFRKLQEQKDFNETIKKMNVKLDDIDSRVCKDGDCMREELSKIKTGLGTEFSTIKTEISELKNLKKDIDEIKKNSDKLEVCPQCGEKSLLHMSSYCSNCGVKIPEWNDEKGDKISSWKPYWLRQQK